MWGRRRNGLTDNFTLAVYMQFLVAADILGNLLRPSPPQQPAQYEYLAGEQVGSLWLVADPDAGLAWH